MIADCNIAGVFIPGLLVLAFAALIVTLTTLRVFAAVGLSRLVACRALFEIASFLIVCGLLLQCVSRIGLLS